MAVESVSSMAATPPSARTHPGLFRFRIEAQNHQNIRTMKKALSFHQGSLWLAILAGLLVAGCTTRPKDAGPSTDDSRRQVLAEHAEYPLSKDADTSTDDSGLPPMGTVGPHQEPGQDVVACWLVGLDGVPDEGPPSFPIKLHWTGNGTYSLSEKASGAVICRNVYYLKTFGGAFAGVSVQLIANRFVAYPETLKGSEIPDTFFHDMMAVTHVYDLQKKRKVYTSPPYRYNHSIHPLKYDRKHIPGLDPASR